MGKGLTTVIILLLVGGFGLLLLKTDLDWRNRALGESVSFSERLEQVGSTTGEWALKLQQVIFGAIDFLGLGILFSGGRFAFFHFLFFMLIFMVIYSLTSFMPFLSKFQFLFALIAALLAVMLWDTAQLQAILTLYEGLGVVFVVIFPVIVLVGFTMRIYQAAHYGKGATSPFWANLFNCIFLIFWGIFFIRYSSSEPGIIGAFRYFSGWLLIALGIAQFVLYKWISDFFHHLKVRTVGEWRRRRRRAVRAQEQRAVDSTGQLAQGK